LDQPEGYGSGNPGIRVFGSALATGDLGDDFRAGCGDCGFLFYFVLRDQHNLETDIMNGDLFKLGVLVGIVFAIAGLRMLVEYMKRQSEDPRWKS